MRSKTDPWGNLSPAFDFKAKKVNASAADNVEIVWPIILSLLKKYNIRRGNVLDFGCGTGGFCNKLFSLGYSPTGIDSSKKMIQIAKKNSNPKIAYICGDYTSLNKKGKYDAIFSIMVLQFLPDTDSVLKSLSNSLKKGGVAIFAVINPAFVDVCSKAGLRYRKIDAKKAIMTFDFGQSFDVTTRTEQEYISSCLNCNLAMIDHAMPPFTKSFLKRHEWVLPSNTPEFLVLAFKKTI